MIAEYILQMYENGTNKANILQIHVTKSHCNNFFSLTLSQTSPGFYESALQVF